MLPPIQQLTNPPERPLDASFGEKRELLDAARRAALRYIETLDSRSVAPSVDALDALGSFHVPMPEEPTDPLAVIEMLDRLGSPATMATTGGRFYGFVVGGALPVTTAASWLAAAWDQNAGTYALSPVAAELEEVVSNWLLDLLDLPRESVVGFVTGSTMGTFSALATARNELLRRSGYDMTRSGLAGAPRLRVVTSEECHPTNLATLGYVGIGLDQVEFVPTDQHGQLDVKQLPRLDQHTIVMLQAGNINSGAFDPFSEVCQRAQQAGAWVHIDGAFGLWARASSNYSHLAQGAEMADSWSVDGHKWLNLPQDSAVYMCRHPEAVASVFDVTATYLVRSSQRQPNTLTPELSRRARGVEFWAALARLGRSGVADIIERTCAHARQFAKELRAGGYEILNEVVLNQVVFGLPTEAATREALSRIQEGGVTWLGPTTWKGRYAMRISVSSAATTVDDVEQSIAAIVAAGHRAQRIASP
ncbi:MAG: aminotransferase class V-fold PLP-dependent enzyme [Bacteroidota bacterium]